MLRVALEVGDRSKFPAVGWGNRPELRSGVGPGTPARSVLPPPLTPCFTPEPNIVHLLLPPFLAIHATLSPLQLTDVYSEVVTCYAHVELYVYYIPTYICKAIPIVVCTGCRTQWIVLYIEYTRRYRSKHAKVVESP